MKSYTGKITSAGPNDIYVIDNDVPNLLDPELSQNIYNHSPDGFNWGYLGSGPSQAALAILLDLIGQEKAILYYQRFKWDFVATWGKSFIIHDFEILAWLDKTHSN